MVIKQRAISDEQKEERRQAILNATLQLFQKTSYEAVSIADVAQKTGIAKGTVYLYFKTKEELFLALLAQEFEAWFDEADACFKQIQVGQGSCTVDELITLMGYSLKNRSTLARLTAILHSILEQNINFATALHFKQMLLARILQTGALLETCLPFLKPRQGTLVMLHIYVLLIGVQQLAEPAPIVRQVIAQKGLEVFQVDFTDYFLQSLKVFLNGLEYQAQE
ncbi:MAG: TetR family transcriptional regulator [Anaerolineae bacterium]|nr:TetR family transcriptional regulator [Anaerolineae bacterium]